MITNFKIFESFRREGDTIEFDVDDNQDLMSEPNPNVVDDYEAKTVEFDIPDNETEWNEIYSKFLKKSKKIDNESYHKWLTKNYYTPIKK